MVVGGMHGCKVVHGCWGACVVAGGVCMVVGGCVQMQGGMHGCGGGGMHGFGGACVVAGGGGHAWWGGMCGIRRDTVNERAVRILLECILVMNIVCVIEKLKNIS